MQQIVIVGWMSCTTIGKTFAAPPGGPADGYPAGAQQAPGTTITTLPRDHARRHHFH